MPKDKETTTNMLVNPQQDRGVIVKIWNSNMNEGEGVGHVAALMFEGLNKNFIHDFNKENLSNIKLEMFMKTTYLSYWPSRPVASLTEEVEAEFNDFYGDITDEGREAEKIYCLYSLNVKEMIKEYGTFKNTVCNWKAAQGTFFGEKTANCASAVLGLLKVGGIAELLNEGRLEQSDLSSSVLPDNVARIMRAACIAERKKFDETEDFDFAAISDRSSQSKFSCTIV